MDLNEEGKLIKQAKAVRGKGGENKPFGKLYKFYRPKVRNYFLGRLGDEKKAEDLTSRVFEKALAGIDSFQWQGVPFSSWLFKIAQNTLFDFFRSSRKRKKVPIENLPTIKSEGAGPEEIAEQAESSEALEHLLFELPKRERDIVYMKFYEGYTNRAIAKLTDLSETNVGTILYRTLRKLRKHLQDL